MTLTPDSDFKALEDLLDGFIAAPVERVMTGQLHHTNKRLKSLASELDDMKVAAEKRQDVVGPLIVGIANKVDDMNSRIGALAGEHQALRCEWHDAHATALQEGNKRDEEAVLSQRRQLHRLAVLVLAASFLSAAAVELFHRFL